MKYLLLLASLTFAVIGQFFLKRGVLASTLAPNLDSIIKTLLSPFVLLGFLAYGIGSIAWLFVLQRLPLSVAYPALSLSYVIIVLISYFFFQEAINLSKILGISLIIGGLFFLFR